MGACATGKTAGSSPQLPRNGHDSPDHEMAGHDMGGHAKAETAFLFPDGDDKGWSVENGVQHVMAPDVPLVKIPAATRPDAAPARALTMDVVKSIRR